MESIQHNLLEALLRREGMYRNTEKYCLEGLICMIAVS